MGKGLDKYNKLKNKNRDQLVKEAWRRGISTLYTSTEIIPEIIYKDAYDEGRNNGLRESAAKLETTIPRTHYSFRYYDGECYVVALTPQQIKLLEWLEAQKMLSEDLHIENYTKPDIVQL